MHWCILLPSAFFGIVFLCTCVVCPIGRDRCTRTFSFHYVESARLVRLHAPFPCAMILNCNPSFTKVKSTYFLQIHGLCRPLFLWWFVVPLMRCPLGSWDCFVFCVWCPVGTSRCLPGSAAPSSCLGVPCWFCLVVCFRLAPLSVPC